MKSAGADAEAFYLYETWATPYYNVTDNAPTVTLNRPLNNSNLSTSSVNFNWTAIDDYTTTLYCNLTIDGLLNQSTQEVMVVMVWGFAFESPGLRRCACFLANRNHLNTVARMNLNRSSGICHKSHDIEYPDGCTDFTAFKSCLI